MQASEAADDAAQGSGNHGWDRVGKVHFAIFVIAVDFRLKGALHLRGVATESDGVPNSRDVDDLESLRLEPGRNTINVVLAKTETFRIPLGSQPSMEVRRLMILLLIK